MAKETYEEKKQQLKELNEAVANEIKALFEDNEKYKEYLRMMAMLNNYSYANVLLIKMQKPDATIVTNMNTWNKVFKRYVNKGEKGIKIIAPEPTREKKEDDKTDENTGKPVKEDKEISKMEFKISYVFDVSQTSGEPLPDIQPKIDNGKIINILKAISPYPVDFCLLPNEDMNGYCDTAKKRIYIAINRNDEEKINALIQTIVHANLCEKDLNTKDPRDLKTVELKRESIAYIVASYLGINYSADGLQLESGYSTDLEMHEMKRILHTIQKKSHRLINQINEKYMEYQNQPKQQMPDNVTISEMERYGYKYSKAKMLPLKEKALELFDENKEVYILNSDNTEKRAIDKIELSQHLENGGLAGIRMEDFSLPNEKEIITQEVLQFKAENGIEKGEFENKRFENCLFLLSSYFSKNSYDNSKFKNCIFVGSNFQQSSFVNCVFENCTFDDVNFYDADLSFTEIKNCNYKDVLLEKANLNEAVIKDTEFDSTLVSRIKLDYTTFDNVRFKNIEEPKMVNLDKVRLIPPKNISEEAYKKHVERTLCPSPNVQFEVWQLKVIPENRELLFRTYNETLEKAIILDIGNYEKVYTGKMYSDTSLENIYVTLNYNPPENYKGRSMSVSDVIITTEDKGKYKAYYVDSIGFKEIPYLAEQYKMIQAQKNKDLELEINN